MIAGTGELTRLLTPDQRCPPHTAVTKQNVALECKCCGLCFIELRGCLSTGRCTCLIPLSNHGKLSELITEKREFVPGDKRRADGAG